jgi:hypothetical protein
MTEARDYLGDEVHMMQSDIKTLRAENELLKFKNERQDETITSLRSDLARMRAAYENKVVEVTTLQTLLENVGLVISDGITRYLRRRDLKAKTDQITRESQALAERVQSVDTTHSRSRAVDRVAVQSQQDQSDDPPPIFLRRPRKEVVDHPLLPPVHARTDEDVLRELASGIDRRISQ